jgi:hypothetical protein
MLLKSELKKNDFLMILNFYNYREKKKFWQKNLEQDVIRSMELLKI